MKTLIDRFEEKIFYSPDGCWYWTASTSSHGYGQIMWDSSSHRPLKANRASWQLYRGPIPSGLYVCHSCDNILCVNPDHLFLGTQLDNIRDMDKKGRRVSNLGESHPRAKLRDADVIRIRQLKLIGETNSRLAMMFNVSKVMIGDIVNRKYWTHI